LSIRSTSAKRAAAAKRKRSPTPKPVKIHVGNLTRNVVKDHVMEIFTTFGTIKFCDFGTDRLNNNKGYCFIEFNSSDDAENAMKNMDGGQIDGQEITCAPVLAAPRPPRRIPRRSPMIRRSPPRWGGGGGGRGRFVLSFIKIYAIFFSIL
jgi:RNA-binding protein with serine-rich domain 1